MAEMGSTISILKPSTSENMPIPLKSCLTNGGTIKARSPADEAARTACLQQIAKKEQLSEESINRILREFTETFEGTDILSSSWLDLRFPNYEARNTPKRFIAPVTHRDNQGHWSLVFVNCETNIKQSTVRVQHYDPKPNDSRAAGVEHKIRIWANRHRGDDTTFQFENATGPQHGTSEMSGLFIIMAARAFVQFGHTSLVWDEDPAEYIRGILEDKRKPNLPRQDSVRPPSHDGKGGQRSSVTSPRVPHTPRKNSAPILDYREDVFGSRAHTPSATTRKLAVDLAGKMTPPNTDRSLEPNLKRRRTESISPLKYDQVIGLANSYPPLTVLREEGDKKVFDLENTQKALDEKNEASALVQQQFEEHKEDHDNVSRDCETLKGQVAKHEKVTNDYLAMMPPVPEGMFLSAEDMRNIMVAKFDESAEPTRKELQGKQELKRKTSDLLESTDQKRIALEVDVRKAVEAQSLAEDEARKAIRLHDEAEAAEEYRRKMEIARENSESSDWLLKWRDRRGGL